LKFEEHASINFDGGIMQHGYQCGMIWGATLAAGAQVYRHHGTSPQAETEAIIAARRLVESFRALNNNINCSELIATEWQKSIQFLRYFIKAGAISCYHMAARYTPVAYSVINTVLSEKHVEVIASPVSCAAMLAQEMGVSNMHKVMVSGFAGGIGLSGGACGALGAAIWIIGMDSSREEGGKIGFKNQRAMDVIDRFMKCTEFDFECSEIIGRRFESIVDHAGHLLDGGCSKIIDVLSSK
jgi:hypothetical protein